MINLLSLLLSSVLWVQVPQWSDDWSKCAVDIPDASCHWYITAPDNTFGEGFDWASAPWFDANGLSDVPSIDKVMSLVLIGKLPLRSFNLSSTVFKAVRENIKTFDIKTF